MANRPSPGTPAAPAPVCTCTGSGSPPLSACPACSLPLPAKKPPLRLRICNKTFARARGSIEYPDIRLCGKWLYDSGYRAGDYIHVEHSPHSIIITKRQ